jgi:hypothetical protein
VEWRKLVVRVEVKFVDEFEVGVEEVGLKLNWKQKMKLSEKNEVVVVCLPKVSGY